MDSSDLVALAGVIVSPIAALAGVWMEKVFSGREKANEIAEEQRKSAAAAIGPMIGILVDLTDPGMVARGELLEYRSPKEAVRGLYSRWTRAREPLMVLRVGHREREVRELSARFQEEVEMVLRMVGRAVSNGDVTLGEAHAWQERAMKTAHALLDFMEGRPDRARELLTPIR